MVDEHATPHQELSAALDTMLEKTARFIPAAFHIHSPDSHDWGRRQHADGNRNAKARFVTDEKEFLKELKDSGLRLVCITDHMKSGFACKLAQAASTDGKILVLPGMEVNCVIPPSTERIHLLVVFPPDFDTTQIERIFSWHAGFPSERSRNGTEDFRLTKQLREWREEIERQGGMLLFAHIDESSRGHRAHYRALRTDTLKMFITDTSGVTKEDEREISEEYKSYLVDSLPHAVEIMTPHDREHYISFVSREGKLGRVPCVVRSDCHCVEDFFETKKHTFIKLSQITFQGLKDAFRFFETRIKFKDDLLDLPSPRIIGLRLRSPSKNGLFVDDLIAFNENLNCLIGPRGCGKSTITEAIRYTLGRNEALGDSASGEGDYREIALGIQRANLADTIIELVYEVKPGERHCLVATYDPAEKFTTEVYDLTGEERKLSKEAVLTDYPVRIYSWSEVEHLGRQPELQRQLLDRLIKKLPDYVERRESAYRQLGENRKLVEGKVAALRAKLDEEKGAMRRYSEYKTEFDRINTPEVQQLFEDLDTARGKLVVLRAAEKALGDLKATIEKSASFDVAQITKGLLEGQGSLVAQWWDTEITPRIRLAEIFDTIHGLREQVSSRVDEKLVSLRAILVEAESAATGKEVELREKTQSRPEDTLVRGKREQSKKRYEAGTLRRQSYQALLEELKQALAARQALIDQIERAQNEISGARQSSRDSMMTRINQFKTADMAVEISFESGKDRGATIEFMRDKGFLSQQTFGQYKNRRIAERCCAMAKPTVLARAILEKKVEVLLEEGREFEAEGNLSQEEGKKLVEGFHPFADDNDAAVEVIDSNKLSQVLLLQEQRWDDALRILLNGRPVDQLSPGQRSSAMLPLVALSEEVPLVIDQPEDNLDNRMVGSTLTKILAQLKEHRQIIVATHNPNIVVGGDAEQVIVLDAPSARKATVTKSGSIDDQDIVESVVTIMEGGKEAFKARERRYEWLLRQ